MSWLDGRVGGWVVRPRPCRERCGVLEGGVSSRWTNLSWLRLRLARHGAVQAVARAGAAVLCCSVCICSGVWCVRAPT